MQAAELDNPPRRCSWAGNDVLYVAYHDHEWGRPLDGDSALFERISLEGFQAGLSWLTILRKRPAFRQAFAGFDIDAVAAFGERDVERLLGDAGIVRHRGKIEAVVNNARRAIELRAKEGSLAAFLWSYEPAVPYAGPPRAESPESRALSRELKRRGWRFVGPTTMYSLMQAVGMVNDHGPDCMCHAEVEALRSGFARPRTAR
ncbi:MAG: DNA-3-methyladenine glycosylase I [Pigmentiphaga sp.]|uniref:DNA-3-methyladenine glycosylase I n=1 Tax=Pigmentiphaga sp. TaxID=1977564 RepID=UPI0029A0E848|nr:DNA-3-methyladenine glycosylase I [Pigmentiphaga sp.]MDX3905499.1 DNA-3-methyladenine glycosylase I [Pigmentiphaga sp.]